MLDDLNVLWMSNSVFARQVDQILFYFISVSVGFEYETCPSLILWEKRTALLQGFELDPSNLGGWSLEVSLMVTVTESCCSLSVSLFILESSKVPRLFTYTSQLRHAGV